MHGFTFYCPNEGSGCSFGAAFATEERSRVLFVVRRETELLSVSQVDSLVWCAIVDAIVDAGKSARRIGNFAKYGALMVRLYGDAGVLVRIGGDGVDHTAPIESWQAFVAGVLAGEFDLRRLQVTDAPELVAAAMR